MKRKDQLIELRQKAVPALRVAAREMKKSGEKKINRARVLTIIREKELAKENE